MHELIYCVRLALCVMHLMQPNMFFDNCPPILRDLTDPFRTPKDGWLHNPDTGVFLEPGGQKLWFDPEAHQRNSKNKSIKYNKHAFDACLFLHVLSFSSFLLFLKPFGTKEVFFVRVPKTGQGVPGTF